MDRTNRLHLPLFESTDKPSWLTDWNLSMTILDDAISDLEIGGIPNLAELLERLSNIESKQASDETIMQTIASCFANNFSSAITYSKGDLVLYENSLYEYTYITPSSGDFDGTKWSLRQLEDLLGPIKDSIGSLGIQSSEIATGLSALESSVSSLRTSVNNASAKADSADTKADNALSVANGIVPAYVAPDKVFVDNIPTLVGKTVNTYGNILDIDLLTQYPSYFNDTDLYRLGILVSQYSFNVSFTSNFSNVRLTFAIGLSVGGLFYPFFDKEFFNPSVTSSGTWTVRLGVGDSWYVLPFVSKMNTTSHTRLLCKMSVIASTGGLDSTQYSITGKTNNIGVYKLQTHSS